MPSVSATLFASLVCAAGAARVVKHFERQVQERQWTFAGDTSMICGGPQIWDEVIRQRSAFEAAMNINWGQAEAFKDAFMVKQTSREELLVDKLEQLARLLEAELASEKPRTTEEHIRGLLNAGLGEGTYGGLANARALKCGKPGHAPSGVPRPPRGASTQSRKLFAEESKAFFGRAEFRLDGDLFLQVCRGELVEEGETALENWCVQLCQRLKDVAVSDSKAALGETAGASDRLRDEIMQAKTALTDARTSQEQCLSDWSSLTVLRDQLLGMKASWKQRNDEMMEAAQALDDAMWESDELQESLESMEAELEEAGKLLRAAGGESAAARAALEAAAAKEQELAAGAQAAQAELARLRGELADAQAADDVIEKLKERVTRTMLTMKGFSNAAVREPLRNMGFDEPTEFPEPETTGAAGPLHGAVDSLHEYCANTAMPAFEEVKQLIEVGGEPLDLTDLCSFENPQAINEDFAQQVKLRAKSVKTDLDWVASWLNPYKTMKKLTMEQAVARDRELVEAGQLANLEEVKSEYSGSPFFKYLIGWRKDGPHHLKIAGLVSVIASLRAAEAALQAKIDELKALLLAAQEAHQAAIEALKKATESEAIAADKKAELEEQVAKLEEQGAQMARDLSELQAALEKAQREVEEAKKALETTYTGATTKGGALAELEAQSAQVQQRIRELEHALA